MSALEKAISSLPGQKTAGAKVPASKTFRIEPQHFAVTWADKPVDGILLGIRVPSERDVQGARTEAFKVAMNAPVEDDDPNADAIRVHAFNDALLAMAVSSAICDPRDVTSNHPFFDMPDELVPLALTSKTIQHIWDMTEALHVEQSPVFAEITPSEEIQLIQLLGEDMPYKHVNHVQAMKARRFLKFALDILEE